MADARDLEWSHGGTVGQTLRIKSLDSFATRYICMTATIFTRRTQLIAWGCALSLFCVAPGKTSAQVAVAPSPTPSPTVPSPEPAPVVAPLTPPEPMATPEPLPAATDGVNGTPPPTDGVPRDSDSSRLFSSAAADEQAQAADAEKRRAAALLQAQNSQAASDVFTRNTFERAETNAETLFNGIGGVPQALNPLYISPGFSDSIGFKVGPLTIKPILSTGVSYGTSKSNGSSSGNSSGFYGSLSPAFTLELGEPATGRTLGVQYTGSLNYGSDRSGRQVYDQSLSASGTFNFVKLNLGVGLDFSQLSGSDRDFGGQNVDRQIIGLSLTSSYIYSVKTNVSATLSAPIRLFSQGSSSEGVNGTGFINYAYSELTTVGIGFGLGTVEVENGESQLYEQALVHLTYIATAKLSFNGTAGCEFLQAGSSDQVTPVFGLGLAWAIREGTTLSVSGERRILNSAAQSNTNYTDTNISFSATQRLGSFLLLTGTIGYENAEYKGIVTGASSNRSDNQLIFQGGVSYRFRERFVASEILSYGRDFSNTNAFESFQTSLQLSYVF